MNDIIPKEQVLDAYNSSPSLVREVFSDESTTNAIIELGTKFQLNDDQASTLGKEVGYLLLGLIDPNRFTSRLKDAGLSEQIAEGITKEVIQKIFVPLRERVERELSQIKKSPESETLQPVKPYEDKKLLQDHEETRVDVKPSQNLPVATPVVIVPKVAPKIETPTIPKPIPPPPPPTPPPPPPSPIRPPILPPTPSSPPPPAKPYSSDPYREPIE